MPLAAQGEWFYTIGPCDKNIVVDHMYASETTGKHVYSFKGKCWSTKTTGEIGGPYYKGYINAKINMQLDPATGVLKEQIIPGAGNGLANVAYKCKIGSDGLRFFQCSVTGKSHLKYEPVCCKGSSANINYPITRTLAAIKDYLKQKEITHLPPVINQPTPGKQYPISETLPVEISSAEHTIWHKLADAYNASSVDFDMMKEARKNFRMEMERFMPKEGGGGRWHNYADQFIKDGVIQTNVIYPEDGMYRVRARHQLAQVTSYPDLYPWSQWQVFWVGDMVDYNKPVPTMTKPEQGSIHTQTQSPIPGSLYSIPFMAWKHVHMLELTKTSIEFSIHRSTQGVWNDFFNTPTPHVQGKTGTEQAIPLPEGVYRARVRYSGGLHPWTDWHYFVAGNPPGGGENASVDGYLPDFWVAADPTADIRKEGKDWRFAMRIDYLGYWHSLGWGTPIKTMVACIPQAGGQTCGKKWPNPSIEYDARSHWLPIESYPYYPQSDWNPPKEPHHYVNTHHFKFRPDKPVGKWILLVSVDPDNFVHESNEGNNVTAWVFDSASQLFQNGLPALEEVVKKLKKLPDGLDEKMLKALRKNGGKSLPPRALKAKPKAGKTQRQFDTSKIKQKAKFGAKVKKNGVKIQPGPAKLSPQKLGLKLILKDAKHVKTLKLTAGKSSEAIFRVINSGDAASKASTYSVECKKLSNAASKCPAFSKRGSLTAIGAKRGKDIKIKLTSVVAGVYKLKLKLANGVTQTLTLKVSAAKLTIKPGVPKSTPKVHSKPRLRLPKKPDG